MIDEKNNGTARGPRPGTWWKQQREARYSRVNARHGLVESRYGYVVCTQPASPKQRPADITLPNIGQSRRAAKKARSQS